MPTKTSRTGDGSSEMGDGSSEISNLLTSIYYLQDLLTPIFYLEDLLTSIFYRKEPAQPLALRPAEDANEKATGEDGSGFGHGNQLKLAATDVLKPRTRDSLAGPNDVGQEASGVSIAVEEYPVFASTGPVGGAHPVVDGELSA